MAVSCNLSKGKDLTEAVLFSSESCLVFSWSPVGRCRASVEDWIIMDPRILSRTLDISIPQWFSQEYFSPVLKAALISDVGQSYPTNTDLHMDRRRNKINIGHGVTAEQSKYPYLILARQVTKH
ncbi:unnamed protein product [Heterobilharzia americana]|nr:unnamed protein product [Heterobilharzia americana]CAH8601341.1 unnamed protein product [Heterobilharzia americana]